MSSDRYQETSSHAAVHPKVEELSRLFYPRSLAIVGVSGGVMNQAREFFLKPILDFGFRGQIYPIHPDGGEVMGLKVYPNVKDVPDPLDYVISCIPAHLGPQLVRDCGLKGVKAITFFTAGFSETGTGRGIELEEELARAGRQDGVRIIGPNCMGVYCPEMRSCFWPGFPPDDGPVGYICQSGGNSIQLVKFAASRGVRFSKVISYGNACDLNECDFLEYMMHDPKTQIIVLYIEGVKDGRRFVKLVTEAVRNKPVLLLKGGITEGGMRATASHTGSLAGSVVTWDVLCKQLGIIQVYSIEELCDMLVSLQFMPVPQGRMVAIFSAAGGGGSVLATDDCERYGLIVPALPSEVTDRLLEFTPLAGTCLRNPIDSNVVLLDSGKSVKTLEIVSQCESVDFVLAHLRPASFSFDTSGHYVMYHTLANSVLEAIARSSKPVAVVIEPDVTTDDFKESFAVLEKYASAGFATYPSIARAAHAINKLISYHDEAKDRVQ